MPEEDRIRPGITKVTFFNVPGSKAKHKAARKKSGS